MRRSRLRLEGRLFRLFSVALAGVFLGTAGVAQGAVVDLVYEFDGNSPSGTTSFGTITITDGAAGAVDFSIVANTGALGGGDIHEFYFNLPFAVTNLAVSNSGGISNRTISPFTVLGPSPPITGGAGSSFDWGVSFGNGGGPPGNGTLTTAEFTLSADQGLTTGDFLDESSASNNTLPVFMAVHFQDTSIFNATSETVGGGGGVTVSHHPEPSTVIVWSLLGLTWVAGRRRNIWRRKC